jgi:hypothetical protein
MMEIPTATLRIDRSESSGSLNKLQPVWGYRLQGDAVVMAMKTCKKCGKPCEIIFRYSACINGVMRYARKGHPFPIPVCDCSELGVA